MPRERRKHSRWRRFFRHHSGRITGVITVLVILAVVFGLFYFMTSSRFVLKSSGG